MADAQELSRGELWGDLISRLSRQHQGLYLESYYTQLILLQADEVYCYFTKQQ